MKSAITFVIGFIIATALQPRPQAQTPVNPVVPPVPAARVCPVFGNDCKCDCLADGPCTCAAFPEYSAIEDECRKQRSPCVVFVGTQPRTIGRLKIASQKAMCFADSCIESGIVCGFWQGERFLCYVLPANAADDDILATVADRKLPAKYEPKSVPAHAAGSSRPVVSYAPTGFQSCPTCVRGR